jgi:hypothetical protein
MGARDEKLTIAVMFMVEIIFGMSVDVLFWCILVYPHDIKIWPMSRHFLMTPTWHDIGQIR